MSRNVAFPFLTIPDSCIIAEPWLLGVDGGESMPIGDYVADWDYATDLQLSRSIELSIEDASNILRIPSNSLSMGLLVEVGTGAGRLPKAIISKEFFEITPTRSKVIISISLGSENLSSFLFLTTTLVLRSQPSELGTLSPKLVNSRLWSDRFITRLDGDEPRFPIEVTSFEVFFGNTPEARAPWYVSWNPGDWNRNFHGAVRLYLNSDHPGIVERIQAGDDMLLRVISVDIVGQILEKLVVETDAEDIIANAPEESLAAQAASWLESAWPASSIASLKQKLESQPGKFRASIWAIAENQEDL